MQWPGLYFVTLTVPFWSLTLILHLHSIIGLQSEHCICTVLPKLSLVEEFCFCLKFQCNFLPPSFKQNKMFFFFFSLILPVYGCLFFSQILIVDLIQIKYKRKSLKLGICLLSGWYQQQKIGTMPMHKSVEVTFMLYNVKNHVLTTCKSGLLKKFLNKP